MTTSATRPDRVLATTGPRYCEIRFKRPRDFTDRNVIRIDSGQIVRAEGDEEKQPGRLTLHPGNRGLITRQWREVLGVYQDQDELEAEFRLDAAYQKPLRDLAEFAFDREELSYTVVRLLIHERSRDQVDSVFVALYRNDRVETQSLPAYEIQSAEPRGGELERLLALVAQRPDAAEALEFVLEQPEGGPSCGCGADHWACDQEEAG